MCDFSALRTQLWLALGLLIAAVTSAILAIVFANMSAPWGIIAGAICFSFAVAWALALFAVAISSLNSALDAFCTCTSRISECQTACAGMRTALTLIGVGAMFLAVSCFVGALLPILDWAFGWQLWTALILSLGLLLVGLGLALAWAGSLASCQSSNTVPAPPTTPTGPGTGTGPAPI
jgi:hypothetical protein